MDVSDEMELIFMKGHKSPEQSDSDTDEQMEQPCPSDCHLKSFLFQHIGQIDQAAESKEEKVKLYLHTFKDLLQAMNEVEDRLDALIT